MIYLKIMKRFLKKSIIIFSFSVQFILAQTIVDLSQDWEENHSFSKRMNDFFSQKQRP